MLQDVSLQRRETETTLGAFAEHGAEYTIYCCG